MQHLGQHGVHPLTLAGGQDRYLERLHGPRIIAFLPSARRRLRGDESHSMYATMPPEAALESAARFKEDFDEEMFAPGRRPYRAVYVAWRIRRGRLQASRRARCDVL